MSTMTDDLLSNADRIFLESNLKGLLQDVLERLEARNAALRADTAFADATPAEARLFAALRGRERTISELARALGVSRQAVHHTVHRLVRAGVVVLVPSEHSGREKIVRISPSGRQVQVMAAANLRQIEAEVGALIGNRSLETLRSLLLRIRDGLPDPSGSA